MDCAGGICSPEGVSSSRQRLGIVFKCEVGGGGGNPSTSSMFVPQQVFCPTPVYPWGGGLVTRSECVAKSARSSSE